MKIDEAIKLIDDIRRMGTDVFASDELEALDMAIEALEDKKNNWERKYWDLAKSAGGDPNEDLPQTYADRIRKMSDEELAYYHDRMFADLARCDICCPAVDFCKTGHITCPIAILNWLRQEAEE